MKNHVRQRFISCFTALLLLSVAKEARSASAQLPEITDWGALGSGCRSRPAERSNVSIEKVLQTAPNRASFLFRLRSYEIDGEKPISRESAAFARDCSIRLALQPPKGTRIKSIDGETRLLVSKEKGFAFQVALALSTPRAQIGATALDYDKNVVLKNSEEIIQVVPIGGGLGGDIGSGCNEARVLGLDLVLSNDRASFAPKLRAKLAGDQLVRFNVTLEACE